MRSYEQIQDLRFQWKKISNDFLECGDTVSLVANRQAELIVSTLDWVLEES